MQGPLSPERALDILQCPLLDPLSPARVLRGTRQLVTDFEDLTKGGTAVLFSIVARVQRLLAPSV
jgi:hypothetical protein